VPEDGEGPYFPRAGVNAVASQSARCIAAVRHVHAVLPAWGVGGAVCLATAGLHLLPRICAASRCESARIFRQSLFTDLSAAFSLCVFGHCAYQANFGHSALRVDEKVTLRVTTTRGDVLAFALGVAGRKFAILFFVQL